MLTVWAKQETASPDTSWRNSASKETRCCPEQQDLLRIATRQGNTCGQRPDQEAEQHGGDGHAGSRKLAFFLRREGHCAAQAACQPIQSGGGHHSACRGGLLLRTATSSPLPHTAQGIKVTLHGRDSPTCPHQPQALSKGGGGGGGGAVNKRRLRVAG